MSKHLNPSEAERLSLLLEECGEVLQVIGKIQRHGYYGCSSFDPLRTSNRSLLEKEIGHVLHVIWRMSEAFDISEVEVNKWKAAKVNTIGQCPHHQQQETGATHA